MYKVRERENNWGFRDERKQKKKGEKEWKEEIKGRGTTTKQWNNVHDGRRPGTGLEMGNQLIVLVCMSTSMPVALELAYYRCTHFLLMKQMATSPPKKGPEEKDT